MQLEFQREKIMQIILNVSYLFAICTKVWLGLNVEYDSMIEFLIQK